MRDTGVYFQKLLHLKPGATVFEPALLQFFARVLRYAFER